MHPKISDQAILSSSLSIMDTIKRYIDIYVPVTTCTLRCSYCYITTHRLFEGALPEFKYSPEFVRKALSKERLGGTCLLNFCAGGETLLTPRLLEYVRALLEEGHYVMIVTNATLTKRFDEIALWPQALLKHLFFKFSYHYLELKKRGLLDVFFTNIRKVRDAGCSFTLELTPSDDAVPYIEEIKATAIRELGAMNHCTIARDERVGGKLPILTSMDRHTHTHTRGGSLTQLSLITKTLSLRSNAKSSVMPVNGRHILIYKQAI